MENRTAVQQWGKETVHSVIDRGAGGILESLYMVYVGAGITLQPIIPRGKNVYEYDWDLLIVLDACRVDALREVADEYEFLEEIGEYWSLGSHSAEWVANTFVEEYSSEISETVCVTGNMFTELVLENREFPPYDQSMPPKDRKVPVAIRSWDTVDRTLLAELVKVWTWPEAGDTGVQPRPITDTVIQRSRTEDPERIIAHYIQPHEPYLGSDTHAEPGMLHQLDDNISKSELWEAYLDNLRYVLDEVNLLLKNVDADRVMITADHGEAFGEWGSTGHQICFPHPCVRKVPLVETKAIDTREHQPRIYESSAGTKRDRNELLSDLGYL